MYILCPFLQKDSLLKIDFLDSQFFKKESDWDRSRIGILTKCFNCVLNNSWAFFDKLYTVHIFRIFNTRLMFNLFVFGMTLRSKHCMEFPYLKLCNPAYFAHVNTFCCYSLQTYLLTVVLKFVKIWKPDQYICRFQ